MGHPREVPLFHGGPFDRLMTRLGFGGDSRRELIARILFCVVVTWFPLLVLTWIGRLSADPIPEVTFLGDFPVHVRFLVALPLLLSFEPYVRARIADVVPLFLDRGLIDPNAIPALDHILVRIRTLRDSGVAELLVWIAALGLILSRSLLELPHQIVSWKGLDTQAAILARGWHQWISMMLYHFLLFRWLWRFLLWSYFLFRVASTGIHANGHHPDRRGGLGFLLPRHTKFGGMVLAISTVMSANIAEVVIYSGQAVDSFLTSLLTYFTVVGLTFFGPLLAFSPALVKAKRESLTDYGTFANRYTRLFHEKWIREKSHANPSPLGTSDIQSLNDLLGSFGHVTEMRFMLMTPRDLLGLSAFAASPLLPLILFKIPLLDLLVKVVRTFV